MNKKTLYIVIAAASAIIISLMLVFAFGGDNSGHIPNSKEEISLEGTWQMAVIMQNGIPTFLSGEFMVFDGNSAACYKGGGSAPVAQGEYTVSKDNILSLPSLSLEYVLDKKSDNYIRLYENESRYTVLLRHANEDMSSVSFERERLEGKWSVVYRYSDIKNEVLEFTNGILNDYRGGESTPAMSSSFVWSESGIIAQDWNKELKLFPVSADRLLFVEADTGYVWELERIK